MDSSSHENWRALVKISEVSTGKTRIMLWKVVGFQPGKYVNYPEKVMANPGKFRISGESHGNWQAVKKILSISKRKKQG